MVYLHIKKYKHMCWQSNTAKKHISDGKVKVFKVCIINPKDEIRSYYFSAFKYELDKQYKQDIVLYMKDDLGMKNRANQPKYLGFKGFHSYLDGCALIKEKNLLFVRPTPKSRLSIGLYDMDTYCLAIVEGYIPEGVAYYINRHKEIISESIVLTNIKEYL